MPPAESDRGSSSFIRVCPLADVTCQFRFETEQRLPGVFTVYAAAGDGLEAPPSSGAPIPPGAIIVPPAITALEGPGFERLGQSQRYSVTMMEHDNGNGLKKKLGKDLVAVLTNAGPR